MMNHYRNSWRMVIAISIAAFFMFQFAPTIAQVPRDRVLDPKLLRKPVEIAVTIVPRLANPVPELGQWDVDITLVRDITVRGKSKKEVWKKFNLKADRNGNLNFAHGPYFDLVNPRFEITVRGGWAYKTKTYIVRADAPGLHVVTIEMERK